jgi:small subunit ribosomal protein S9
MAEKNTAKYYYGLGRRKEAIAKVRIYLGKGKSLVSEKEVTDYFGNEEFANKVYDALKLTGNLEKMYISAHVEGGGLSAQADAILLGVSRALVVYDEDLKTTLRKAGYLTRDPRIKERKKPGLKRARKAPQFSKR